MQYTIAMMGYGPEDKNAVLELTYNYGVTEYDKGNAYAQVHNSPSLIHMLLFTVYFYVFSSSGIEENHQSNYFFILVSG